MPAGPLAPFVAGVLVAAAALGVLLRTGARRRASMNAPDDLRAAVAALEARLALVERAVLGRDTDAATAPVASAPPATVPSAPPSADPPRPVRYDHIRVQLPGVEYTARMSVEGEERIATFPMLRGALGACQARVQRDAERDVVPDAVLDARLDAEARRVLEEWVTACLKRGELPPRPAPLVAGAPVYRAVPVRSPQLAAALATRWREDEGARHPTASAAAPTSPPARLDQQAAKAGHGLHFTARVELEGYDVVANFPRLPDCEARTTRGDEVDTEARVALETWLAAQLINGKVPPQPVHLVAGQVTYRAVPVTPTLAAALEKRWRAAEAAGALA